MATGRLGAVDLAATTNTAVYTCPASTIATVNITVANRNSSAVTFRLAHLDGAIGTLAAEDYIAYDRSLAANDTVEFTGRCLGASEVIGAYASTTGVTVQVTGETEAA